MTGYCAQRELQNYHTGELWRCIIIPVNVAEVVECLTFSVVVPYVSSITP